MKYNVNEIASKIVDARCEREGVTFLSQEERIQYWKDAKDQIEPLLMQYYVAEDKLKTAIKNLTK